MRNLIRRPLLRAWLTFARPSRLFVMGPLVLLLLAGCQPAAPTPTPAPTATATPAPTATPTPSLLAERYYSARYGYSLDYPSGWVVDDSDPSSISILSPGRVAAIAVIVDDLSQFEGRFTLDEYLRAWLDNSRQSFPDMEELSRTKQDLVPGLESYQIVVTYGIGGGERFKSHNLIVLKGDLAFSVEAGAKDTVYDEYRATVGAVLKSFRPGAGIAPAAATATPQAGVYSRFGFVFHYPPEMKIEEEGLESDEANAESGLLVGKSSDEVVSLTWLTTASYDLEEGLDAGISSMQDKLTDMTLGAEGEGTVDGNRAIYQTFAGTVNDAATEGSVAVWYCEESGQGFSLVLVVREEKVEPVQARYLDAFRCGG